MSTGADLARRRRFAAAAFLALLILSVFWPSPVISLNRATLHEPLPIDELSFLGREAPSWDVVFWCLVGLFGIALLQSAEPPLDFREPWRVVRATRFVVPRGAIVAFVLALIAVPLVWKYLDAPITAWAEGVQSDAVEDLIRITNRLGGGMNPALVVGFFLLAGIAYKHRRWIGYAVAMAIAGLGSGIAVQLIKYTAGRARPELWLGPFHHARASATSFPSGHTVGAFALAGVLLFRSRSWALRIVAILLAIGVGLSRVLAFRHWTSDVVASAAVGLIVAWVVAAGVMPVTSDSESFP